MKLLQRASLLFVLLLLCAQASAQVAQAINNTPAQQSTTMPAGKQFAASRHKQFWWGKHWRKEWLTPVAFPILDLDTTAGGLTPKKEGGGKETKSLRMLGNNGKEYVLRTIDKNPDTIIPAEYKGSFVEDIVNDQISTAHPYSSIVVAQLSEGIAILHTNPSIVFVPDNERLGAFKKDFTNKLCLFEERPSGEGWKYTSLTNNASDIINTEKLFEKLQADNRKQVDQKEFLKIRLFDMVINDWDRHSDQWLWAAEKKDDRTIYRPFARDRDQAFSKTDGVYLFLLTQPWAIRHLQNMNKRVTDVTGSSQSGVWLDKKFLNQLTEDDWKETIITLQRELTDSVIETALRKFPDDIYKLSADFIGKRLRSRRDDMMRFGMRYYHILNKHVDITGSDKNETIVINRSGDHSTEVSVNANSQFDHPSYPIFHLVFDDRITKQINVYGLGGNDTFIYQGTGNSKSLTRSFGNNDYNAYVMASDTAFDKRRNTIYENAADSPRELKARSIHFSADTATTNYHWDAFKYDWWLPIINLGYNPDDGLIIGAGIKYKKQQWNKHPFGWEQTFVGNYAASTGAFNMLYRGIFTHAFGKWDFDLKADYKAPSFIVNFYGYGNDTKLEQDDKTFYRTRARSLFVNPQISRTWRQHSLETGILFNSVKVEDNNNKFITKPSAGIDSSVFRTKYFGGVNIGYAFRTIDSFRYPTRGINFHTGIDYLVNLQQDHRGFVKIHSSFTFYITPLRNVTVAHRTGAAINEGDFEFYQANTLGGVENMRGYWRSRFTGKSSFYQNTDLRIKLGTLKGYVFRGTVGLYGFFDDGRVWVKDDHSGELHTGYGGGFYFLPFNALALNIFYATSKETNTFTIRTGFLF